MAEMVVDGVRLTYELAGTEGPVLVLLNGIAMSISHWKPMIGAMEGKYRTLCHDMRGQTLSGKPEGAYSLELHARDLAALMDGLGIEKAHIAGTSYGSEVAMAFALAFPERCLSLAVIDGVSELDPVLRAAAFSWKATALADPRAFYRTLLPWTYSGSYIRAHADALAAREEGVARLPREWFEAFARLCDAFLEMDLTPRLGEIACPCLVMVGDRDILKHEGYARIIARGVRDGRLVVLPDTGHAAVIEQPGFCAAGLSDFLSALSKGGSQ